MKASVFICLLTGALCFTCTVADHSSNKKKDTINELVFTQEGEDSSDDGVLAQVISRMIQKELAQQQDDDRELVQEQDDDGDDDADTEQLKKKLTIRRRYYPYFKLKLLGRRLLSLGRQVSSIGRQLLFYRRPPFWRRRG